MNTRTHIIVAALAIVGAFVAYASVLDVALLGWDSYPIILTSKISSWSDVTGTLTEELMDGRYTDGSFYRPFTNVTFALNYWIGELDPTVYHATDILICGLGAWLIFALARRTLGLAPFAAACAAAIFLLHPVQLEILPTAPRRADNLALLFTLLAILNSGSNERWAIARTALFCLLAVASKETGIIALPLSALRNVLEQRASALRRTGPAFIAVALFLGLRTAVLGGLGGHAESGWVGLSGMRALLEPYFARVVYPQPIFDETSLARSTLLGAALGGILCIALVLRRPMTSDVGERTRVRQGLLLLVAFGACGLAVSSTSGRVHDWYALLFCAPYALLLGLLIDYGRRAARRGKWALGVGPLALAWTLVGSHVWFSNPLHRYEDLEHASELQRALLASTDAVLADASVGSVVIIDDVLTGFPPRPDGSGIRSVALMNDYSFQAYAELKFPGRPFVVQPFGSPPGPPRADEIGVALKPAALPEFLRPRLQARD